MDFIGSQLFAPTPDGVDCELMGLRSEDGAWHRAALYRPQGRPRPRAAIVIMHPATDFLQHYALGAFAQMGFATMGVAARFAAESDVIMEQCLLDVASAVKYLRELGCERVTVLGNSGGGGLMSFYQAEAEDPTVKSTPAGDPPDLTEADLPAADAVVFLNAHQGRAQVMTGYLDPSVVDESEPLKRDPSLDMYDPDNGPPYPPEFVERYRAAQVARNDRITTWAKERLAKLRGLGIQDEAFIVHRTTASLEFLDLSQSQSDRPLGWYGGPDVKAQNLMASSLARFNTLRSWLSSYGLSTTNALSGPNLGRVSVPLLIVQGTADEGIFPRDAQANFDAAASADKELHWIKGGNHFFAGQPELQQQTLELIGGWLSERGMGPE
jgi:pimeloyl-ACP methyl ester carboxylesterase